MPPKCKKELDLFGELRMEFSKDGMSYRTYTQEELMRDHSPERQKELTDLMAQEMKKEIEHSQNQLPPLHRFYDPGIINKLFSVQTLDPLGYQPTPALKESYGKKRTLRARVTEYVKNNSFVPVSQVHRAVGGNYWSVRSALWREWQAGRMIRRATGPRGGYTYGYEDEYDDLPLFRKDIT